MVISCIVYEMKRQIGRKSSFFHSLYITVPAVEKRLRIYFIAVFFFTTEPDPWPE